MSEEKVISKVRKLLAKAEGTDNQEEADAFFAKAEEIMLANALDEALIRHKTGQASFEVGVEEVEFAGIFRSMQLNATSWIAQGFGFKCTKTKRGTVDVLKVYGVVSELKEAMTIITSLQIQCARAMKRFEREYKDDRPWAGKQQLYVARRSFIMGYGEVAGARIKASRQRIIDEIVKTDDSLLPVLRDTSSAIEEFIQNMYPNLRKGRRSRIGVDNRGYGAGGDSAMTADIGNARIAGRKELGA
jgi:hypothetical protein